MPRRSAEVQPDVPLFLVAHVIQQRIRTHGEELERVIVTRTHRHFYTVSVRTRPIRREYQSERAGRKRGGERR
jgi:hypothetical protein